MNKINRFFERIIKEEIPSNVINLNENTLYSYGVSEEGSLFTPYDQDIILLCTSQSYAKSLAESSVTSDRLLGSVEIPTIIQSVLYDAKILEWNDDMDMQYGELFHKNIVAPQKLNTNILDKFSTYDGISYKGRVNNYVILLNSDKLALYKYSFYVKDHGWGDWYTKEDALHFLFDIFSINDSSSFF